MNFHTQFQGLKKLNLPADQFVVVGSGALAVRGIRDSGDLDVVVTDSLWNELLKKYKTEFNSLGAETLCLKNGIEILNPRQSIFGNSEVVPLAEIFTKADLFEGIKFINLLHLSTIKLKIGREKDFRDVELIRQHFAP